jgi:drug/metabolite transporter (DMT)-like permease
MKTLTPATLRHALPAPSRYNRGSPHHESALPSTILPPHAMSTRFTPSTILMLVIPPLLWASNAVVGRMVQGMVPPVTMNFIRWIIAFLVLLPLAGWVLRRGSVMWAYWRRFMVLGLLGIGVYNALQYLALKSSSPINVTLVGASMPVWMLLIGMLFFHARVTLRQVLGAALSIAGVLVVLSRGEAHQLLALRLVPGDLLMMAATIAWSVYSWLLALPPGAQKIRQDWSAFLMAQVAFGLAWSGLFAAGEWLVTDAQIHWSWPLAAALLYVGTGPALIALRFWGTGVQRVGPGIASFFNNLTPLFAALLSSAFLGDPPHLYHALAFLLIVGGIVLSSRP